MLASLIRTFVPIVVGWLLSIPIAKQLGLSAEQATQLVTAVVIAAYYAAARVLERYVTPKFGWLLGKPGAPAYVPTGANGVPTVPAPAPEVGSVQATVIEPPAAP